MEIDVECVHIRAEDAAHSGIPERFDVVLSVRGPSADIIRILPAPYKTGRHNARAQGQDIETEISDSKGLIKTGRAAISVIPYTIEGSDITHSIVKINKELPTPRHIREGVKIGKFYNKNIDMQINI